MLKSINVVCHFSFSFCISFQLINIILCVCFSRIIRNMLYLYFVFKCLIFCTVFDFVFDQISMIIGRNLLIFSKFNIFCHGNIVVFRLWFWAVIKHATAFFVNYLCIRRTLLSFECSNEWLNIRPMWYWHDEKSHGIVQRSMCREMS